jgi:4-hydroxybenzoate polyprenyltransferase
VIEPYIALARLNRPIGWQLLLLPCFWTLALAQPIEALSFLKGIAFLGLFTFGAIVMRSAGCVWNDILDRDIDAAVNRTRNRPLASGVLRLRQAFGFLVALLVLGLFILLVLAWLTPHPKFVLSVGVASLVPVVVYPLMKRILPMPQLVLGFAFAWGVLLGFAAVEGALPLHAWLLYGATVAWIIGYDTIYALQDIEDDARLGVHSSARLFGTKVVPAVALFYGLTVLLLVSCLLAGHASLLMWGGVAVFGLHLAWQVYQLQRNFRVHARFDESVCLRLFKSNCWAGAALAAAWALAATL